MPFHVRWKSSTLDDRENQHCNRNCIGCSASPLTTAGLFLLRYVLFVVVSRRVLELWIRNLYSRHGQSALTSHHWKFSGSFYTLCAAQVQQNDNSTFFSCCSCPNRISDARIENSRSIVGRRQNRAARCDRDILLTYVALSPHSQRVTPVLTDDNYAADVFFQLCVKILLPVAVRSKILLKFFFV